MCSDKRKVELRIGEEMIIDKDLLDKVSKQANDSLRLRMNYIFH